MTPSRHPRQDESRIQKACVRWFRLAYHRLAPLLFAVPNGGARDAVTGARLKAEGVYPGVADLLLLVPANGFHGAAIEMKTPTGRLSASQKQWRDAVIHAGYAHYICRSVSDFVNIINSYLDNYGN